MEKVEKGSIFTGVFPILKGSAQQFSNRLSRNGLFVGKPGNMSAPGNTYAPGNMYASGYVCAVEKESREKKQK